MGFVSSDLFDFKWFDYIGSVASKRAAHQSGAPPLCRYLIFTINCFVVFSRSCSSFQKLKEANIGIQNVLNAIQQGILTKSTKDRLEELESVKEDLENKILSENLIKPKLTPEFVTYYLQQFRKLDATKMEHRKILIDTFVNAIFMFDDKIVLTFNYKDGTKTISLADIKGSDLGCFSQPDTPIHRIPMCGCFFVAGL